MAGEIPIGDETPQKTYSISKYHPIADGATVLTAHQTFFEKYQDKLEHKPSKYWEFASPSGKPEAYTRIGATGIPLTVRYGRISDFSPEYLAVLFDSAGKTFMEGENITDEKEREKAIVRQVGWTITEDRLISTIEYEGNIIAGVMGQAGSLDQSAGEIIEHNKNVPPKDHVGTIRFELPDSEAGRELAVMKDAHLIRGTKYFRIPDGVLQDLVPESQEKWNAFKQLISTETQIGRAFAIDRFNRTNGKNLQQLVLETPNQSVMETYTKHYGGELILTESEENLWPPDVLPNPHIGTTWWVIKVPIPQLLDKVREYDRQIGERKSL